MRRNVGWCTEYMRIERVFDDDLRDLRDSFE